MGKDQASIDVTRPGLVHSWPDPATHSPMIWQEVPCLGPSSTIVGPDGVKTWPGISNIFALLSESCPSSARLSPEKRRLRDSGRSFPDVVPLLARIRPNLRDCDPSLPVFGPCFYLSCDMLLVFGPNSAKCGPDSTIDLRHRRDFIGGGANFDANAFGGLYWTVGWGTPESGPKSGTT